MISIHDINGVARGAFNNSVPNACPYFDDKFTENSLTGVITLEFSVPMAHPDSKLVDGFSKLTYKDKEGDLRLFNVMDIYEDYSNDFAMKTIMAEDVSTTELNQVFTKPFASTDLEEALQLTLVESGWAFELDYAATLSADNLFTLDSVVKTKEALFNVTKAFGVEVKFMATVDSFGVSNKIIKVYGQRGTSTGKYFYYDRDLLGLTRTVSYYNLATAVLPLGKDNMTIANWTPQNPLKGYEKEFVWDFIMNTEATEKYAESRIKPRYQIYKNDLITDKDVLYREAIEALKPNMVPVYEYTMDVILLENVTGIEGEKVNIGDTVWFKARVGDHNEIGVEASVVELVQSKNDPSLDTVTFSNFREINVADSADVNALRNQVNNMQNDLNNTKEELETTQNKVLELSVAQEGIVTSLNGKSSISIGTTPNPSPNTGDTWINQGTSGGKQYTVIKTWDGTVWVPSFDSRTIDSISSEVDNALANAEQAIEDANAASGQAAQAKADAAAAKESAQTAIDKFKGIRNFVNNSSGRNEYPNFNGHYLSPLFDRTYTSDGFLRLTVNNGTMTPYYFVGRNQADGTGATGGATEIQFGKTYTASIELRLAGRAPSSYRVSLQYWVGGVPTIVYGNNIINEGLDITTVTQVVPSNATNIRMALTTNVAVPVGTYVDTRNWQLEVGTFASSWTSNPTDAILEIKNINGQLTSKASQSSVDSLTGVVTGHTTLISQNTQEIQLKASQSTVNTLTDKVELNTAAIQVNADAINLRVEKDDLISQINIQAGEILISTSGKLILDAETTVISNALIKDAMIESVTASKLTAGTIDAGIINVVNLNASEIKSGDIVGINIQGTTITNAFNYTEAGANFVGKMVMSNAMIKTDYTVGGTNEGQMIFNPLAISSSMYDSVGNKPMWSWELSQTGLLVKNGDATTTGTQLSLTAAGIQAKSANQGLSYEFAGQSLTMRPMLGVTNANTGIEMYGVTQFIDFHPNNTTADYGARIRAIAAGTGALGSSILQMETAMLEVKAANGRGIQFVEATIRPTGTGDLGLVTGSKTGAITVKNPEGEWRPIFASAFTVSSDRDLKKNIEPLGSSLEKVLDTPVYYYHREDDFDFELKRAGFMIQDSPVEIQDPRGGVEIYGAVAMSWKAIQEMDAKFEKALEHISELEKRIAELESR